LPWQSFRYRKDRDPQLERWRVRDRERPTARLARRPSGVCIVGPPILAWGDVSHLIIAFKELNDTAREQIEAMFRRAPEFNTFAKACSWPDHPRRGLAPLPEGLRLFRLAEQAPLLLPARRQRSLQLLQHERLIGPAHQDRLDDVGRQ
jgi:hypothetical protein